MISLHKKKGFMIDERLLGTYRFINSPLTIKSLILDISGKVKTIDRFMDKKSVLNYHTLRISGKVYAENYANDSKITGNIHINFLKGEISYYINFKNYANEFCYIKGRKLISMLTFVRDLTSLEGEIFNKQTQEKIADIQLFSSKKKFKSILKSFKVI